MDTIDGWRVDTAEPAQWEIDFHGEDTVVDAVAPGDGAAEPMQRLRLIPQPDAIASGVRVGNYVIDEFLARGGFGEVWRAHHRHTGEPAAFKVLHEELLGSRQVVLRFEREIQAIASMRHPSVVELYECDTLPDGRPYFIMEFIEGRNLSEYIATCGTLTPEEVLAILEPLAVALEVAHERGLVHRDVKASNVMLGQRDGERRVVLLDFGVAKLLGAAGPNLTSSRCAVGTPACMAPEQMLGEAIDARADVYSLGALAYQMLSGELPFANAPAIIAEYLHLHGPRPRPSDHVDVPGAIDEVVARAMAKSREDRYSSATAFVRALRLAIRRPLGIHLVPDPEAPVATETIRVIGLYLMVRADEDALDDPDDELVDDLESVVPLVARKLQDSGFQLERETGNAALFVRRLCGGGGQRRARQESIAAAHRAVAALDRRPDRDDRVHVSAFIHVSETRITGDDIDTAPLLTMAEWSQASDEPGLLASGDALEDLDAPLDVACEAPLLYRVLAR